MISKKISFGVLVGGLSIAVSSLSGLIIYPLLVNNVSSKVAGLWLFYISLSTIISLGQAGLAPIVMRRAGEAMANGDDKTLADYYTLIKKSYFIVFILVTFLCVIIYWSYVHWVLIENKELFYDGLISWIFFVLGNLLIILSSKNFYIINGFGEVGWDKVNQIIISIITISGYFITLNLGFGLIGLSFVFFIASIIHLVSSKKLLKKFSPTIMLIKGGEASKKEVIQIFKEGGEILILKLVSILVLNKDIFLVERFLGLSILPGFSALSRIQGLLIAIALLIPQMFFPYITKSFTKGHYTQTKKMYWKGVVYSLTIGLVISLIVYLTAGKIFPLWIGEKNYLGDQILFWFLFMGLIQINHNSHASAVISTGKNSFVWPAIINALGSVPLAIIGIKYYGIVGMLVGNLIATVFSSIYVVIYSIRYFNTLVKDNNNKEIF
jgi:O-antigen/teichoic acid export membrane protein